MRRSAAALAVLSLLLVASRAGAHHSIAGVYDTSRTVDVEGTIIRFRFVNPHPYIELRVEEHGVPQQWRLEMDNRSELAAAGITVESLRFGDEVQVTGNPSRSEGRAMYVQRLIRREDGFSYEQVGSSPRVTRRRPK